jgi:hypothetical protein
MKRVIICAVVGTVIFFGWQMLMWMGGFNDGFSSYTPKQDTIMQTLDANLDKDGMYFMPSVDPALPDAKDQEEKLMKERMGKPWAMINYHKSMEYEISYMLLGVLYALLACLVATLVIYYGKFNSFRDCFLVAFSFGLFTLFQGVLDDMNWWGYPWTFVRPEVMDLTVGWGITSLWIGWFLKRQGSVQAGPV